MNSIATTPEIREVYRQYTLTNTIRNSKVACALVIVLMPAGYVMDSFVFPSQAHDFLLLRLLSSCLAGLLLITLSRSSWPETMVRILCTGWYLIPSAIICVMIAQTKGLDSTYYAGLNLVILAVSSVIQATLWESIVAVGIILAMYTAACIVSNMPFNHPMAFNNGFFLFCTSAIVITGNYFYNNLRFREFTLRYELDTNRKSLEENNRKLIELDRLKSRFFANVSHEMRTPLTLLLSPLEMLAKRYAGLFDQNTQEMLQTMQNNGMRLLKLINDLLELIRLESGRLEIKREPLAMMEFMSGLGSAVNQMAVTKQITLATHTDAELGRIIADRDKLEKIVLNLLFNSLKFTPKNGRIWLRAEKIGDYFTISVKDTGIGIAEKSLPFVFDRFWQEDGSSKRKFQGVGIGLALVKELTETMGGIVTVESQPGKGAIFMVRLPYEKATETMPPGSAPAAAPGAVASQEPSHSEEWLANLYRRAEFFPTTMARRNAETTNFARQIQQRPRILVADDEPDMRQFLVSQLEDEYEVIEARDGNEATEKAQSILPDVILLDLMMPHKDGLQVCRELREYAPTVAIPIILLTARADEEAKFDALQMGANDFLAKPFSSTELQARIRNLIESHHFQRKLTKQNQALSEAIDQIKETEMQLVQSEKLSSLGRMSAGIIHEINNPLNFSLTGLFALRNKGKKLAPEDRSEYEAIVNDIEEGIKRVRNIVSDLRTFTHPGGGTSEPVEAGDAVNAALRFLSGEWRDVVTIHQEIDPGLSLWANRNKLIHVLVNLLQNAIDALREKQFVNGEKPQIWLAGKTEGHRTIITVRDNGPGIEKKIVDKIFDPFFTTKEVGKGMGLGLSICYRIVQGYGGKISVNSERGEFCEFVLDFPADADAATEMEIENGESIRL
jgi:signal transduction histidine kinase